MFNTQIPGPYSQITGNTSGGQVCNGGGSGWGGGVRGPRGEGVSENLHF